MLINELQVKGRSPWRLQCQLLTVTLLSAALPCKSCVCRGHNKLILSAWHNPLRSLYVICFCSRRWLLLLMFVSCKLFHPNKKLDQMQRHSSQQQQQQRQPKQQQQHSEEKTKQVNGEESNATVTVTGVRLQENTHFCTQPTSNEPRQNDTCTCTLALTQIQKHTTTGAAVFSAFACQPFC